MTLSTATALHRLTGGAYAKHLKIIAANIKREREARKWTQAELAERSNLAPTYISSLESGEINTTLKTLYQIAGGLGVKIDAIWSGK